MSFMSPEVYETDYWHIETDDGTYIVPLDVETNPEKLQMYVAGRMAVPTPEDSVTREHGWVGRLNASGYLDCTDWIAGPTEASVRQELHNLFEEY